jgi:hypothetical protein
MKYLISFENNNRNLSAYFEAESDELAIRKCLSAYPWAQSAAIVRREDATAAVAVEAPHADTAPKPASGESIKGWDPHVLTVHEHGLRKITLWKLIIISWLYQPVCIAAVVANILSLAIIWDMDVEDFANLLIPSVVFVALSYMIITDRFKATGMLFLALAAGWIPIIGSLLLVGFDFEFSRQLNERIRQHGGRTFLCLGYPSSLPRE